MRRLPLQFLIPLLVATACSDATPSAPTALDAAQDVEWTATGHDGDGRRQPPDGSTFTVTFRSDGDVVGTAGCNRFFGDWTRDGDRMVVGPLAITEMGCRDRADWFDLLALLTGELSPSDQGAFTLTTAEGTVIRLEAGPADPPRPSDGEPNRSVSTINEG